MFEINLIKIGFSLITLGIVITSFLLEILGNYLPVIIKKSFYFGKFAKKEKLLVEVPHTNFKHFYIFGSAYITLALIVTTNVYIYKNTVPLGFLQLLDFCVGSNRIATVSVSSTLIALILLAIQIYRRLYETHFVSVYSERSKMSLTHYMVGYAHYAGAIGAILAEAPYFSKVTNQNLLEYTFNIYDLIGILLFFIGWVHQYRAAIILADIRKDTRGKVVSQEYKIPEGDWFDYLSAPHLVCEILMYIALSLILWGNTTWLFCLMWVACNQSIVSIMNHTWYKETFSSYPKNRKALIPFIF